MFFCSLRSDKMMLSIHWTSPTSFLSVLLSITQLLTSPSTNRSYLQNLVNFHQSYQYYPNISYRTISNTSSYLFYYYLCLSIHSSSLSIQYFYQLPSLSFSILLLLGPFLDSIDYVFGFLVSYQPVATNFIFSSIWNCQT